MRPDVNVAGGTLCTAARRTAHPVAVVGDVKGLVSVEVHVVVALGLLGRRPHKAPDGQVIRKELLPVVPLHSFREILHLAGREG